MMVAALLVMMAARDGLWVVMRSWW
jgi:hypothetical protein